MHTENGTENEIPETYGKIRVDIVFKTGINRFGKSRLYYDCHKIESCINDWKEEYLRLFYGTKSTMIYKKECKSITFIYL